jgi:hypothetical protein
MMEVFRYDRRKVELEPVGTFAFFQKNGNCSEEVVEYLETIEVSDRDLKGFHAIKDLQKKYQDQKKYKAKGYF